MEKLPNWDDAVAAAGMSTVYIAEDWVSAQKGAFQAVSGTETPSQSLN